MCGWSLTLTLSLTPVGLNADASRDSFLFFMDYKSSCPPPPSHAFHHSHMSEALEEQLLSYSENAENEGEEVEYLEEEEVQDTPEPRPSPAA